MFIILVVWDEYIFLRQFHLFLFDIDGRSGFDEFPWWIDTIYSYIIWSYFLFYNFSSKWREFRYQLIRFILYFLHAETTHDHFLIFH